MKAFRFRLQPILELREGAEQRAKEQLAETIAARSQGKEMLRTAEDLVEQADVAARQRAAAPVSAADLAAQQLWRERLERYRQAADENLEQVEQQVALSRGALVEAHRKRATLDRLKELRHDAHRADAARREANEADEIAQRQHHARRHAA
jgi:flagellar protein FliJ